MAPFKVSKDFLRDIFSIPFPSTSGNFAENNVFRNKQDVELTCKSKGDLKVVKDNVYVRMLISMPIRG